MRHGWRSARALGGGLVVAGVALFVAGGLGTAPLVLWPAGLILAIAGGSAVHFGGDANWWPGRMKYF